MQVDDGDGGIYQEGFQVLVLSPDTTPPTSFVASLPARAVSLEIPITVVTADPNGPAGSFVSGVLEYDLYVAVDSGAFTKYATVPATLPTTIFQASSNHTYYFRSVARDAAGNIEYEPGAPADAQIQVGDFDVPVTRVYEVTHNEFGLFTVRMSGTESGGGQLRFFDLYVSVDGGTAELVSSTSAGVANASDVYSASTNYQGRTDGRSHTYRFFSIGRDSNGNIEVAPSLDSDVVITRTFAPLGLTATGIDVQLGASQRSYIRHLDILFNQEDELDELLALGRIKVERFALDATDVSPGTGDVVSNFSVGKVADRLRLDFGAQGITGTRTSNAGDGFYRVMIDTNRDGDFEDPEDARFHFFRILGDTTGDAQVDQEDLNLVNSQFGRTGTGLAGDTDGSGQVNVFDRAFVNSQISLNRRLDEALRDMLDD